MSAAHWNRGRTWPAKALGLLILCILSVAFLAPLLWSMAASLKSLGEVYAFPPSLWVDEPKWSNYRIALSRLPFFLFIWNTLIICVAATIGQLLASSMVGYSFARLRWRGRDVWFVVLLATMMLPGQVLLIPHYLIFQWLGWIDTYKPLIVPSWLGGSAFFIFLFRQFFKSVPREMEEAARIDGASNWQIYWHIFLPNAKAILATVAILGFIGQWKDFMSPLIYLSTYEKFPISLGLRMYQTLEGAYINYLMAASIVASAPLILIFFLAQRYFVKGLLLTGSKG